jgi:hypothetical protein
MCFQERLYKGTVAFFLETDQFDFDSLWNMINNVVKPDSIDEIEMTSWTEARSFKKNELEIYFEEFYADTPSRFKLQLFPFDKNHSNEQIQKLREIVALIEQNISMKNEKMVNQNE